MILPALNWRKLPPRIVTGSSVNLILNNIYDMLTGSFYFDGSSRVTGSNSAWQNVGRFITGSGTGSNTEAVYCYPPTQTVMSQSVIICGINNVGARTVTANVLNASGSVSFGSQDFGIACVKNAGTFSSWSTGSNGFGAGSQSTGIACFYSGNNNGVITPKITIYESQEALAVFFSTPSTLSTLTYGGIAGAFVDPEQITTLTDAEADNRLYGVTTTPSGPTTGTNDGLQANWINSTPYGLFYHIGSTLYGIFLIFQPQARNTRLAVYMQPTSTLANSYMPLNTLSGKFNKYPITVSDFNSSGAHIFLGRLREVYFYKPNTTTNQILRDGTNNIFGFTVGRSEAAANDTIILAY